MVNKNRDLKGVRANILKIQLLNAPASILIGLSLYGIFAAKGDAFHPLLNDMNIVYTMLAVGVVIEIVTLIKLLPLFKLQRELSSGANT
jgi:hypothetical protein